MNNIFENAPLFVQFETSFTNLKFESTVLFADIDLKITPGETPDHSQLLQAAHDIGESLKSAHGFKVVLFNYPAVPGSLREMMCPILECVSHKKMGEGFGVAFKSRGKVSPMTPFGVIGVSDEFTQSCLEAVLPSGENDVEYIDLETAELLTFWKESQSHAHSALRAEIERICEHSGADFERLTQVAPPRFIKSEEGFNLENFSPDTDGLNAVLRLARRTNISCPLLESLQFSTG